MIIVGGRTRSEARSHRSTPGPDGFQWPCSAGLAGQGATYLEPLVTARWRDLRVVLTCDDERP